MRGLRRWTVVAAGTAALCATPSLVGLLPARADRLPPPVLLAKIRASASVGYSGLAESAGRLGLPSLPRLGTLDGLLSGTTRTRVWYAGPHRYRVDRLSLTGEEGAYADDDGGWTWSSGDRSAVRLVGTVGLRLPQPVDLLPPQLARRLAASASEQELRPLPPRRVAGRSAAGLRIVPAGATTLRLIDVWADPATGLPLQVELTGAGARAPSITARFLDLRLGAPGTEVTTFRPPPDADLDARGFPDLVALADRYAPYALPDQLAGAARRPSGDGAAGGAGTYGQGYAVFAVLPLQDRIAFSLLDRLTGPPARPVEIPPGRAVAIETSLLTALLVVGPYESFVLAGTVPASTLEEAARDLTRASLPLRSGR